jgi:hypothetical protein
MPTVSGPSGAGSPAVLAALDETELFVAQPPLQALGDLRGVLAKGEGRDGLVDWQHLLQEFRRHPIAHDRRPLDLQEQQLGPRAVRKQLGFVPSRMRMATSLARLMWNSTPLRRR